MTHLSKRVCCHSASCCGIIMLISLLSSLTNIVHEIITGEMQFLLWQHYFTASQSVHKITQLCGKYCPIVKYVFIFLLLLFTRKSKPSVSTVFEYSCQTERQCSHQERNILEVNFLLKSYVVNIGVTKCLTLNLLSLNAYFTS